MVGTPDPVPPVRGGASGRIPGRCSSIFCDGRFNRLVSKEMVAQRVPRPKLLVLADCVPAETLRGLFGTRGFVVVVLTSQAELERHVLHADVAPAGAMLD